MTLNTRETVRNALHVEPGRADLPGLAALDAEIYAVHRDRDFGRVEAMVKLLVKEAGRPVRPLRIRTSVETYGTLPLRHRLVQDAMRLARHVAGRQSPLDRVA